MRRKGSFSITSAMRAAVFGVLSLAFALVAANPEDTLAASGNMAQFTLVSNSYIATASTDELKTFSAITLEAWIKPNVAREWALIMGKQYNPSDSNPWYSYRLCKSHSGTFPDTVNFSIAPVTTGGEVGVTSTTVVQNDVWTHVAGVYDGATMKIYINGVLENTAAQTGDLKASDLAMFIGKAPWTNYNNFNGQMDELRVWNVARTREEIQYYMNRSLSGTEEGLVAYWQFNDAAGSPTTDDSSPYNHIGTLYNGAAIIADSTAPICYEPPTGMVSWWGGDGNAVDMVGSNDGTLVNGATYGAGRVGQAFSAAGVDDYLEVPHSVDLSFGAADPMSINLWVYRTGADTSQHIIGKRTNCTNNDFNYQIVLDPSNGGICFASGNTSNMACSSGGDADLPLNTWTNIAATYDGISEFRVYINGQPAGSGAGSMGYENTTSLRIGTSGPVGTAGCGYQDFDGLIDEATIFNRALTPEDVYAMYTAGSSGLCRTCADRPAGIVSWWQAEGDATDFMGNDDGALVNGTTFAAGLVGQAFNFDGVDDRVDFSGATGDFGADPFTVEFLLQFPASELSQTHNYLLGKSHPDGGQGWDIRLNGDAADGRLVVSGVNGWAFNIFSNDPLVADQWQHVALVGSALDVSLYVNGTLQGTSGRGTISTASNPFRIGMTTNFSGSLLQGRIDETTIYSQALTATEVVAIANSRCAGKCTCAYSTYYRDADNDTFGDPSDSIEACSAPAGYVTANTDCNDSSASVYPGATEIPDDGIDQNCSGADTVTCYADIDQDGFGSTSTVLAVDGTCDTAQSESGVNTDCNDNAASVYPGATEIPDDGIDQNCNGTDTVTCYADIDQDGFGSTNTVLATDGTCDTAQSESGVNTDCNDSSASVYPGATEIPDDGIDQSCSGSDTVTCYADIDQDGFGSTNTVLAADGTCDIAQSESGVNTDCDDANAEINPGATEICDKIDNNCDAQSDEDGVCGGGFPWPMFLPAINNNAPH